MPADLAPLLLAHPGEGEIVRWSASEAALICHRTGAEAKPHHGLPLVTGPEPSAPLIEIRPGACDRASRRRGESAVQTRFASRVLRPASRSAPPGPGFKEMALEARGWVTGYRRVALVSRPEAASVADRPVVLQLPRMPDTRVRPADVASLLGKLLRPFGMFLRSADGCEARKDNSTMLAPRWSRLTAGREVTGPRLWRAACPPLRVSVAAADEDQPAPWEENSEAPPETRFGLPSAEIRLPERNPAPHRPTLLKATRRRAAASGPAQVEVRISEAGSEAGRGIGNQLVTCVRTRLEYANDVWKRESEPLRVLGRISLPLAIAPANSVPASESLPAIRVWSYSPPLSEPADRWRLGILGYPEVQAAARVAPLSEWEPENWKGGVVMVPPSGPQQHPKAAIGRAALVRWPLAAAVVRRPLDSMVQESYAAAQ